MLFGRATTWLGRLLIAAATVVLATGCALYRGDSDEYGPRLGSVVASTAIFDGRVVETGRVDVNLRGDDGAVLGVETVPVAVVDDVEMLVELADNPYQRDLYERFATMAAASEPIEIVVDRAVTFDPGKRYRFFLSHFGLSTDLDYWVGFAWDLDKDVPADGQSARGWRSDVEALRSAGLIDDTSIADALLEIASALNTSNPNDHQRQIVIELLGESMVPVTVGSTPPTTDLPAWSEGASVRPSPADWRTRVLSADNAAHGI